MRFVALYCSEMWTLRSRDRASDEVSETFGRSFSMRSVDK